MRILQNLRPVLKEGDKVVVNDHLIPGMGEVSSMIERQIRSVMRSRFSVKASLAVACFCIFSG